MALIYKISEVDKTMSDKVGGKGANLGELSKMEGLHVPEGFIISVDAFQKDIHEELSYHVSPHESYAVRSSATLEDSPTASFAGQYETYLNIMSVGNILTHVVQCWASFNIERAVAYRNQNNLDHNKVHLAVVVQKMVPSEISGVMFTADPMTSNRKVLAIEAVFGLGDALVSGQMNSDAYKVREGNIIDKKIQASQALTDQQILELEKIGRKIEQHFGSPQDIEWCFANDTFYIVQSRPITTLFPIPESNDDEYHVYLSVGHQQMMTDALKPLGLSLRQLSSAKGMVTAAGRQFVDVAKMLAVPSTREMLLNTMSQHDPLMKDALESLGCHSNEFIPPPTPKPQMKADPGIVSRLIQRSEDSITALKQNIEGKSGRELIDFIVNDIDEMKKILFEPQTMMVINAAMNAGWWLNEKMKEWLGEKNVSDVLSQSVPNNVTSEMGLALLDVADAMRVNEEKGNEALNDFLEKYGMRCPAEIDITRPRWIEQPSMLMPIIRNNIKIFAPGESKRKFEKGLKESLTKEQQLVERLKRLPGGDQKITETQEMITLLKTFTGYREYPKYAIVKRFWIYKQALLQEAERRGIDKEDLFYMTFEELQSGTIDNQIIRQRKEEYRHFEKLQPPRVITSDGEVPTGLYKHKNLPVGAIAGLAVSTGIVEGRARVVLNMEDANIEEGDILITKFTDPSWTPLFVSIKGLITEVGGLMTHGAVIAREYGLPAVVGVQHATTIIKDGQRIRVNGTDGFVKIL